MLLNAQIVARKFWRVVFLLPLMLSPVAVSWMIGKSMMEVRFGPVSRFARWLGWDNPSFFGSPEIAQITIMLMDAWNFIPFMMIMILAGLQALPREVLEAAKVDGASGWQSFWQIVFPLMLPVSVTAIMIRHAWGITSGSGNSLPRPGPVRKDIATSISRLCQPI